MIRLKIYEMHQVMQAVEVCTFVAVFCRTIRLRVVLVKKRIENRLNPTFQNPTLIYPPIGFYFIGLQVCGWVLHGLVNITALCSWWQAINLSLIRKKIYSVSYFSVMKNLSGKKYVIFFRAPRIRCMCHFSCKRIVNITIHSKIETQLHRQQTFCFRFPEKNNFLIISALTDLYCFLLSFFQ